MNTRIAIKPRFERGDKCRLMRAIKGIYSGSIVVIQDMYCHHSQYRYQVQATEYMAAEVWVEESELEWVL